MKKLFQCFTLLLAFHLLACEQKPTNSTDATSEPEANLSNSSVEQTVQNFNQALIDKDRQTLENLSSDGLSYGHSSGVVQDKQAFVEDVVSGPFTFLTIDTENQTIEVTGDLAIVRHTFVAKGINNGDSVDVRIGNSQLYRHENGDWRLLLRQAFKL